MKDLANLSCQMLHTHLNGMSIDADSHDTPSRHPCCMILCNIATHVFLLSGGDGEKRFCHIFTIPRVRQSPNLHDPHAQGLRHPGHLVPAGSATTYTDTHKWPVGARGPSSSPEHTSETAVQLRVWQPDQATFKPIE